MLILVLSQLALGREIVHEARPKAPPEAWYLFQGRARCGVIVVVGADGAPADARPDQCPGALAEAGRAAAMRWRWVPGDAVTTETIDVTFPAPAQLPRRWDGDRCLHAFRVTEDGRALEQDPTGSARCGVQTAGAPFPADFPAEARARAWCAVDLVVSEAGVREAAVAWCPAALTDDAVTAARSFGYRTRGDTAYRVLLAYDPPTGGPT